MYGILYQRLGVGRTLFRDLGVYDSARILSQFGVRTFSSNVVEDKRRKERKPRDDKACHAYLVNSCGLSPEVAQCVSRYCGSLNPEKADAVLKILREHGFDDTQVSKLVKKVPQVIFLNAEKIVLPKLKFFSSIGIPSKDLSRIVTANPALLTKSLEKSLVPKLEFLKALLVHNSNVIKAMKSNSWIFLADADKNLAPNISALREVGVSQQDLQRMMKRFASVVIQSQGRFQKCFDEVTKMGFHPKESSFIRAMHVFSSTLEASRDRKIDILKKCGMSENEIQSTFKICPQFMMVSDKKLMGKMEFLVEDMRWFPSDVARYPLALLLSLENRLIPRCSIIRLLQSKDLVGPNLRLSTFLRVNDKAFYDKYVKGYLGKIPQLLDSYQGKMSGLDSHGIKQQGS